MFHFYLLERPVEYPCESKTLIQAWSEAIAAILPGTLQKHFTIKEMDLRAIARDGVQVDCIVSPANSFGIMDGG